ncbi:MAG: hypothetical protein HY582_02750 [Candidatus Omnitrophica bacterium]|nr:hypothetical protein [Candidatus Omnitrophota bacterium]
MKLFQFFIDVFCIFAFLTMGSLIMVVALHILPMEDALIQVQALYESSVKGWQLGTTGVLLIFAGLTLAKWLVKKSRKGDDFFTIASDIGRLSITYLAVNEVVQRSLKKFDFIKQSHTTSRHTPAGLRIVVGVQILAGKDLTETVQVIKQDVEECVTKMLKYKQPILVDVNVEKIIEEVSLGV